MPELAEVETACRTIRAALTGQKIVKATIAEDSIVLQKTPSAAVAAAIEGSTLTAVGRRGKTWWIEFDRKPWLGGHLGMAGWIRELGQPTIRLKEHGEAPLDDEDGNPRFMKMILEGGNGRRVTMTDGRRLSRLWLSEGPDKDPKILQLGPDALTDLPTTDALAAFLAKRKAPVKALLMDQSWIAGIGNWLADEVLYQARINPARPANTLTQAEIDAMRGKILHITQTAVDLGADETKYPGDWLFHVRWGGGKGQDHIDGKALERATVGGRTTAWVPELQK